MPERNVLEEIVARKARDVAEREERVDPATLELTPSTRSLHRALAQPGLGAILECKRASPSQGLLRDPFEPADIVRSYAGLADAISVLTDEPYFGGHIDHLRTVSRTSDVPVLCKDFFLRPFQVLEARAAGADAVLVMLSVLDDDQARALLRAAAPLGVDCLVETHSEREIERALALGAKIVGINNRDLQTLRVDLSVTERLARRVPGHVRLVSESGMSTHGDLERLGPQVDGVLVGSSLMRAPRLRAAARELLLGRVKICGLTSARDAREAQALGASFGGLIRTRRSARHVELDQARAIVEAAPDLSWVAVFADDDLQVVIETASKLNLAGVQLHGQEDASYLRALRAELPEDIFLWKARGVAPDTTRVNGDLPPGADRLLFDTQLGSSSGGTGTSFDWSLLGNEVLSRSILAGGIGPTNLRAAQELHPWAVDVSSGVESHPGVKSSAALRQLFRCARPPSRPIA